MKDSRFEPRLIICGQHLRANTPSAEETADLPAFRLGRPQGTNDCVPQQELHEAFNDFDADIALVLGDRFELLSVAETCTFGRIPLAHCSGGERTFGAFDDQVRDAVTKLAHLHLVSHQQACDRVVSLQEEPWRIAVTGDPGLDTLLTEPRMRPDEIEALTGACPSRKDVVLALHPVTRAPGETSFFLSAFATFCEEFEGHIFLSAPNGDPGSDPISECWQGLASQHPNCHVLPSLGARAFRGLVAACGALAGNSSAGIWEAPSLGTPSLDVGTRQQGRVRGKSVLNCGMGDCSELAKRKVGSQIRELLSPEAQTRRRAERNPYGDGKATPRILNHIYNRVHDPRLMTKA